MKRCRLTLLTVVLVTLSGVSPSDGQNAGQVPGGGAAPIPGANDAIAQNAAIGASAATSPGFKVHRAIHANVVAIDQPYVINRLGASQPEGMIFVLKSDLVPKDKTKELSYDNFKLRDGKRPRPLVLRMNVGDLLEIHFENWLLSLDPQFPPPPDQKVVADLAQKKPFQQWTRYTGIHVNGLELVPQTTGGPDDIKSDGSWVGANTSGLLPPRSTAKTPETQSITYRLYARSTGTFLLTTGADTTVHQLDAGLFGAVNVQPQGAEWYRSQTTRCEMQAATLKETDLRALEQRLGDRPPPPPPDLALRQLRLESDEEIAQATDSKLQRLQRRILRTFAPSSRAQVIADVYVDPVTKRIYSKYGQPLINYFAVFAETGGECPTAVKNKPVLSMLRAIPEPSAKKYPPIDLPDETYNREIESLDNGFIPFRLRSLFEDNRIGIQLASDATVARVAHEEKYSWIVTNPARTAVKKGPVASGKTYLVQGHEEVQNGKVVKRTLTIAECLLELVYSDLTALITGPNAGDFPYNQDIPDFYTNPASPNRRQPYREFTIIYYQAGNTVQAFPQWSNNNLFNMINAGLDQFAINYGIAAIGPEIVANRLGVGPMGNSQQTIGKSGPVDPKKDPLANQKNDSVELKYEEFFLSSWCVGDPAMIVDVPANAPNQMVDNPDQGSTILGKVEDNPVQFGNFKPLSEAEPQGKRPTKAFYPDDPSNVYHSYMRDHTKMRVLHAGPGPAHVHHLHAHQWLKSPNSPEATYLDSQLILPGSAYTLEITYNGSGNRNQTVGDSIFHCHFYPHFAKGMWSLWRVHDTFEEGTELDKNGVCVTGKPNRALPDGEIAAGTPTPALVPMPTLGMAPMPAPVQVTDLAPWYNQGNKGMGRRVHVIPRNWNRILRDFDKDHDGKLSDDERAAWYKAIETAEAENGKNKTKYGDPGYIWVPYALFDNPGYPFFVPGVGGHRPPHPPLDMAWKEKEAEPKKDEPIQASREQKDAAMFESRQLKISDNKARWTNEEIRNQLGLDPARAVVKEGDVQYLDGGLPRHLVLGGDIVSEYNTRWDFSKDFVKLGTGPDGKPAHIGGLYAFQLPEDGTLIEKAAMRAHSTRAHKTALPENGDGGNFILNGLGPINGAPYADPSVTDDGNSSGVDRRYQAAVIQTDVVLNKKGWHYPQSRFITLWEDVAPTISNTRAPEPFFIRTSTNDATELWHTNLVPNYYQLDDFQVRTPTDVIGQHIHLVKFDVTASDGGANGWNYEDGTFGPDEVRDRIHAIMNVGGLYGFDRRTGYVDKTKQKQVAVWKVKDAYPKRQGPNDQFGLFGEPPPGQDWNGAMTTIQRWSIDPLLNWQGQDRTLRTVFTHDHLSPSTHQQVGLYAGVLVEPEGSQWYLADGKPMNTRVDGGPTSWQAMIVTADPENSHREYAIEFQDMQLAYTAESTVGPRGSNELFMPRTTKNPDGNPNAPSAFYIGQAARSERLNTPAKNLLDFVLNGLNQAILPNEFPKLFAEYGIILSPKAKVTVLQAATSARGYLDGQWRIDQPPLEPGGEVNGGDFYIVKASNPGPNVVPNVPGRSTVFATCLSVFTPSIPPGFSDPERAVNPNPGSNMNVDDNPELNALYAGNTGTPGGSQGTFGNGAPYPSLVSTRQNGTYSMNYRNEPVQLRVKSGNAQQTDLARAFSSIDRDDPQLNKQPSENDFISTSNPRANEYKFPPPLMPWVPAGDPGGPQGTDPFTPLIRGYVGDDIQIRTLVGAHLQPHAFAVHGVHWLSQPSYHNSGYRNVQSMGISEHYEMRFKMPSAVAPREALKDKSGNKYNGSDYFYSSSTGAVGLSNGLWGIMRVYDREVSGLSPLVNNPKERFPVPIDYKQLFNEAKAKNPTAAQTFRVVATTAAKALPEGKLIYNQRADRDKNQKVSFSDPNAVLFVRESDLDRRGKLKEGVRVEPLILRAAAGDWIKMTLINGFPSDSKETPFNKDFSFRYGNPFNDLPMLVDPACNVTLVSWGDGSKVPGSGENLVIVGIDNNNVLHIRIFDGGGTRKTNADETQLPGTQAMAIKTLKQQLPGLLPPHVLSSAEHAQLIAEVTSILGQTPPKPNIGQVCVKISQQAGLHPQLVAFDVTKANGINVGLNPDSTVGPGGSIDYYWYAGEIVQKDGKTITTPVEFGASNLVGADLMLQTQFGLVGALIVEPQGSTWTDDTGSHAFSTVTKRDGEAFRECVLVMQNMVSDLSPGRETAASQTGGRDAGFGAVNYRTENFASRNIATAGQVKPDQGFAKAFSNDLWKAPLDPETPVFVAAAGTPTRFRVVMPSTTSANAAAQPVVFALHGHGWQDEPYIKNATEIGHNNMAQFIGSQEVTVTQKYDIVIDSAGGPFQVPGDYLFQAFNQEQKMGIWGLFRVTPPAKNP
jgi:hypothetical protein